MPSESWPQTLNEGSTVYQSHGNGSEGLHWFVSSKGTPGAYRLVGFHVGEGSRWFTCSCPVGFNQGRKMGDGFDRPCRHVQDVTEAEAIARRLTPVLTVVH